MDQAHLGLGYNVTREPQVRVEIASVWPLVALMKRGGAFDSRASLDLAALDRLPGAIAPKSFGIGAMIAAVEAKQDRRFRAIVETGLVAALKAFGQTDMGCTILPRFVVESDVLAGTMVAHPVSKAVFDGGVAYLPRRERRKLPQAAQLLVKHLKTLLVFAKA